MDKKQDIDWRHPELQALISQKARLSLELQIIDSIVSDPDYEYDTGMDADYSTYRTDRINAVMKAVHNLVKVKGRYHTEQAFKQLVAALDATSHANGEGTST
jgi:hypothetical protein